MNDLIRLAMDQAADEHGAQDRQFTATRFYGVLCRIMNVTPATTAAHVVRVVLAGRRDVELLPGGKYRIKE